MPKYIDLRGRTCSHEFSSAMDIYSAMDVRDEIFRETYTYIPIEETDTRGVVPCVFIYASYNEKGSLYKWHLSVNSFYYTKEDHTLIEDIRSLLPSELPEMIERSDYPNKSTLRKLLL